MPEKLWSQMREALLHDLLQRGYPRDAVVKRIGVLIVTALAITGFVVGSQTYLDHQAGAKFYQDRFDVAVSIACTGHIDELFGNPQVDTFLRDPSGELRSCDGVDAARSKRWTDFDATSLYLYMLASLAWVFLGFSWSSLWPLAGVFAAGFTVGAYLFVRCFTASRIVAAGLALAALFAPPVLREIPNLRDFSKAPLILLGLGLIAGAAFSAINGRRAIYLAAIVGILIGLGAGLRPDVIVLAPVALATFVLLWRDRGGPGRRVRQIATALLALVFGYLVAFAPVAAVNATKNATTDEGAHILILGFAERFQDALGFDRGNYSLIRDYSDEQAEALVNLYRSGAGAAPIVHSDPPYGPPSYQLLAGMLMTTPHDALMRVFATANAVGAYPLNNIVYGPALVILLAAGLILLPRRTTFYCISACVIVPTLSLQFAPRHAFYVVVFGAAALGLAYTIVVTWRVALIVRVVGWPGRAKIVRRSVLLGGAMATAVLLVCATDSVTRTRQEHALVALHEAYRNANWSPVEMVRDDAGVSFPSLTPPSERNVGLMALSFAFTDPDSMLGVIGDLRWRIVGSAQMTPLNEGFRIATDERNYALRSRRIQMYELSDSAAESEFATLSLRVRGTAVSGSWSVGVLSYDETRWIGVIPIPLGAFDRRVTFRVPHSEPAVFLVWEADVAGGSSLDVNQVVVLNRAELQICAPRPWSIAPLHRYRDEVAVGTPVPIPAAESGTYYFPFARLPGRMLTSVKVDGALSRCITRAQIAQMLPTHTVPIELIEVDDAFRPTARLSWGTLLASFARWQRPARY